MAVNKTKLNSIPQRNKDVVFGFAREEETKCNNINIPEMIKYLCLLYLNQNKDKFVLVDNTRKDNRDQTLLQSVYTN